MKQTRGAQKGTVCTERYGMFDGCGVKTHVSGVIVVPPRRVGWCLSSGDHYGPLQSYTLLYRALYHG